MPQVFSRRRKTQKMMAREKGYVLFQKFIPGNTYDTRVIVIGNRAWGFVRYVRKNDFRASGSGNVSYLPKDINPEFLKISFDITNKLNAQCLSLDFIQDEESKPYLAEISYGFPVYMGYKCTGFWDADLNYHEENFIPEYAQIENVLSRLKKSKAK